MYRLKLTSLNLFNLYLFLSSSIVLESMVKTSNFILISQKGLYWSFIFLIVRYSNIL